MAWIDAQRRRTYQCWQDMKRRCYVEKSQQFKNYGARGITVCDSWLESFSAFVADMGLKPEGMSLDRIDNDKGYGPENCRWATPAEQRRNQRTCHYIEFAGERRLFRSVAREYGIHETTLLRRIRQGMTPEEAVQKPLSQRHSTYGRKGNAARWGTAAIAASAGKDGAE